MLNNIEVRRNSTALPAVLRQQSLLCFFSNLFLQFFNGFIANCFVHYIQRLFQPFDSCQFFNFFQNHRIDFFDFNRGFFVASLLLQFRLHPAQFAQMRLGKSNAADDYLFRN
jgi:hypothetical protein